MEFAIIAPVLLLFIVGIWQLGVLFLANSGLKHAVAEGSRLATTFPRPADTDVEALIVERRFGLEEEYLSEATVVFTDDEEISYADVSLTYEVPLDFIFFEAGTVTLSENRRVFVYPLET
ncbi:MAG TPA: TadE family protein [Allosphingosinicella sp.]|jgi:hypothetical protein